MSSRPSRGRGDRRSGAHELERLLSKAGLGSRSQARAWIVAGRVRVNGVVIVDPEAWFDAARDAIELDGARVALAEPLYVALHKPRGYVTTRSDPDGRPTVYELVDDAKAWLVPVGRLDLDTSGLLLLTNDTAFADLVTSPASHVAKTYVVDARPRLDEGALERLRNGVELPGDGSRGPTLPARVANVVHRGPTTRFELAITEGRNRQVRRMVKAVGSKVERLVRVAIGPVELGTLASGRWRVLDAREVRALRDAARAAGRERRAR